MMIIRPTSRRGFTLVELAIVLAVAGILFTGLWRLLASGNQQLKDSAAATQQAQLISSVKSFLASPLGQNFIGNECAAAGGCAVGTAFNLPLPTSAAGTAACYGAASLPGGPGPGSMGSGTGAGSIAAAWCSTLPSGFSSATTNSYGQTYLIQVEYNAATSAPAIPPTTYSVLILTQGGDVISDASGGRISSQIGGDGGFVYTTPPAAPCAALFACGAYGAWAVDPTTYGFTNAGPTPQIVAGHIGSRTYVSPEQDANLPWLARQVIAGGTGYNTMSTDFYLNASGTFLAGATNKIFGTNTGYGGAIMNMNQIITGMNLGDTTAALTVNDNSVGGVPCNADSIVGGKPTDSTSGTTCKFSVQINGNQSTTGIVVANALWANTFIYGNLTTSDINLKKDIKPLSNSLDDVMKLKPVTFKYKKDNKHKENIGFIAQDLQKVYPQIVVGRPDGILGVDYIQLMAPLVSSIQELKKQNDELREELKAQRAELRKLQDEKSGN